MYKWTFLSLTHITFIQNNKLSTITSFGFILLVTLLGFSELQAQPDVTPGDPGNFITTWKSDNTGTSSDTQITIPTTGTGYNYDVYWVDVNNAASNGFVNNQTGDLTIDFPAAGTYSVEISGDFPQIFFNDGGDKDKILTIEQWGDIAWRSMSRAFYGASKLTSNATDEPELGGVTDMSLMLHSATSFNGNLSQWKVDNVTNMNLMFFRASSFDGDLSDWNVGKVMDMTGMFSDAISFTGDLSRWDVSSVKSMASMFRRASSFNSDLSNWKVGSVTSMFFMFSGATSFNSDLSLWDVSKVQNMQRMFGGATSFNGDVSNWDVSSVENMGDMFSEATSFNGDLSRWDVSNVTSMGFMFFRATNFNGDLLEKKVNEGQTDEYTAWDVSNVTTMPAMFEEASSFNGDISNWNVSSVTRMERMFQNASSFNGDLSNWDVSKVNDMSLMLDNSGLSVANYDATLIGWSELTLQDNVSLGALRLEYCNAASARQNIIDTYNWTINGDSFNCSASAFITTWKTDNQGSSNDDQITIPTISSGTYDYDIYWEDTSDSSVHGTILDQTGDATITFPAAGTYRVEISGEFAAIYFYISGDENKILSIDQWGDQKWFTMAHAFQRASNLRYNASDVPDLSGVRSMQFMFQQASLINGDFNDWDVSNVEIMTAMFGLATSFNGNISDWDVSSVTDMRSMFSGASSFNKDLSKWEVSNVELIRNMFQNASSFTSDLSNWNVSKVQNLNSMFAGATSFNSDLNNWDVSNVETMSGVFSRASSFNSNLSNWDVRNVTDMSVMLNGSGLSEANYDATLIGWSTQPLQMNVDLGADGLTYCDAQSERQSIIDTYNWNISGDTFGCPPPDGSDQRVLAANNAPYVFSGSNFGISESGYSVKIETLPGNGQLLVNGTPVNADDILPIEDINDGDLTWDPQTDGHGYNYTNFDFREIGADDTPAEDPNTMTVDLGTSMMTLTAPQGWRLIGNPSSGDTHDTMFEPVWTKGIPGSDDPSARFPSIYRLDQEEYIWEELGDMSTSFNRGQATLVYIFADDNNASPSEGFPKMLESGTNWQPLADEYAYSGLFYDPDQPEGSNSHFLVANPHPISLDFCEFIRDNVAKSVDFWDPAAGGGNGDYVNQSCSEGDVFIAPFQGFWVRTTDNNTTLEVPEAAYLGSAEDGDGYLKDSPAEQELHLVQLRVTSEDQEFTNKVNLLFSEQASEGLDEWDAPKLSAKDLAPQWLSFYSLDEHGQPYAMQSLPADMNEKVHIPLDIETTKAGGYTMEWTLPEPHIFEGSYFLRDNHTGDVMELMGGASYNFLIDTDHAAKTAEQTKDLPLLSSAQLVSSPTGTSPRFELLVTTAGVDGMSELGAVPEEFVLAQNYPNPFNPTTQISYQLPVTSQVRLEVYDMVGRSVATLVSGQVAAGRHTVSFDASGLSSGVYLYRLQAGNTIMTRKLTVVK